jgi:hypothetical protein
MSRLSALLLFAVACLHAQPPGYTIESSATSLKVIRSDNKKVVFDAAADAKAAWNKMVRIAKGTPMEAEFTYRPLSSVGPYLSLEEAEFCDCGGAHPTAVKRFRSIDLSRPTPAPADLTAIYPVPVILAALRDDPAVSKILPPSKPESLPRLLSTLQDLTVKVKDCEYGFNEDLLRSFAFYDLKETSVSVRLSLPAAEEVCRGEMTQLGLPMPIPESLRTQLLDAKNHRAGLLMIDAPRNPAAASFKFSVKPGRR